MAYSQLPFLLPAILIAIVSLSEITSATPQPEQSQSICKDQSNSLICQVQEMKLKIAQLESILDQSTRSLDMKFHYLREKGKLIEEMANKIDFLHTVLANIKVDSTYTEERISTLEEEVRLLWAASRKNNFDIHNLESKAQNSDNKIHAVTSDVRKMTDIVTEQWIEIQQLDQALVHIEMRILKAQRRAALTKCTFLKFIKSTAIHLPGYSWLLSGKQSVSHSYISKVLLLMKSIISAVKEYHHELQRTVKCVMEMNELTAAIANQEVIFFVASVLVIFPLWVAWMLLLLSLDR